MDKSFLRRMPLFADLSDDDLDRFFERARLTEVPAGVTFIREGEVGDTVYIIVEGELEVTRRAGDRELTLGVRTSGEVIGEMALFRGHARSASVTARTDARLLAISNPDFEAVLSAHPGPALTILRTIAMRLQSAETQLVQQQKMAALGTLAAGLAHELNNPAAALHRSAAQLQDAFDSWLSLTLELVRHGFGGDTVEAGLDRLVSELSTGQGRRPALDPLTRSDRELALESWLDARGVERAWELAPLLVEAGWDAARAGQIEQSVPSEALPAAMWWLGSGQAIFGLLHELKASASVISDIVKAVKNYAYLDLAPIQEIDIHEGLEQTLLILRYKLRGVTVHRRYAENLPRITAYGSELNQVWTNIIDNAIDAMDGAGELTIETSRTPDGRVLVAIEDNGPGIPPDVQARLFDPFYTTKSPGQGTGLGLNITYNIVVQKHRGSIDVDSGPGHTRFEVRLPVNPPPAN